MSRRYGVATENDALLGKTQRTSLDMDDPKSRTIVVFGRSDTGKSFVSNWLLGNAEEGEIQEPNQMVSFFPSEGKTSSSSSSSFASNSMGKETEVLPKYGLLSTAEQGVALQIVDTPAVNSEYISVDQIVVDVKQLLEETQSELSLVVYCINLRDARSKSSDETALKAIVKLFGGKKYAWERIVFVATRYDAEKMKHRMTLYPKELWELHVATQTSEPPKVYAVDLRSNEEDFKVKMGTYRREILDLGMRDMEVVGDTIIICSVCSNLDPGDSGKLDAKKLLVTVFVILCICFLTMGMLELSGIRVF